MQMSTEFPIMTEPSINSDPKLVTKVARAVSDAASAVSDTAAAGQYGKFKSIVNLGAAAVVSSLLIYLVHDNSKVAQQDRTQHSQDLKQVVDMVANHQKENREDNNRNSDRITKSVDDLAHEIRASRTMYQQQLKDKDEGK
jgi:hypothetical protein